MKPTFAAAALLSLLAAPALAQQTVILGSVGSSSANGWPSYVAIEKGFFAAEGLKPDQVFAQSNALVIQQLAVGAINFSTNSGMVDPIRAIEKGVPLAIIRIEVQIPPYSLLAKSSIKSIKDLKGKIVSVGGAKDITRLFVERMLETHSIKPGEFDMIYAGATSARFAALQAGAADAAILTPPFNFHAQTAGFTKLGDTIEYTDMPFAAIATNKTWAASNQQAVEKVIRVYNRSMTWLYDPKNREEAVQILMKVSKIRRDDVEEAYDFLIGGKYFEATGKVSKARVGKLVDALKTLGDIPRDFSADRLYLPGITQVAD